MNIPECREFVVKHRPKCCGQQVDPMGYEITNSWQIFICRSCNKSIKIKYWPLYEDDIRDLKLNVLL
jgi:hypothetical protein